MYAALWRVLPGPTWVRVLLCLVLLARRRRGLLPVGLPRDQPAPAVHGQHRRCGRGARQGTMERMTRVLVVDNYDSFVFTIVGYLEQLGAECEVVRNDAVSPGRRGGLRRCPRLPRPRHARGGRGVDGDDRVLRRAGPADARRVPGPPGARGRHGRDRRPGSRAAARQDLAGAPRRHRGARGCARPVHGDALPLADDRPRDPARHARRERPHRVGDHHGRPAHLAAPARRAVPPGVGAHPRRAPDARDLAASCAGCRMPSSARSV